MEKFVFGIDLGGTTVKLGLLSVDGVLLDKWEIPTCTENGGEKILPDIAAIFRCNQEGIFQRHRFGTQRAAGME